MAIQVPPEFEPLINRQIASGRFQRPEDVIRAALTTLESVQYLVVSHHGTTDSIDRQRLPEPIGEVAHEFHFADIPRSAGREVQAIHTSASDRLPVFLAAE